MFYNHLFFLCSDHSSRFQDLTYCFLFYNHCHTKNLICFPYIRNYTLKFEKDYVYLKVKIWKEKKQFHESFLIFISNADILRQCAEHNVISLSDKSYPFNWTLNNLSFGVILSIRSTFLGGFHIILGEFKCKSSRKKFQILPPDLLADLRKSLQFFKLQFVH